MLSLFQRKRVPPTAGTPPTSAIETPKGSMRPESAASLLATPRRQKLLEHIWQRTSLSRRQFATLYLAPLERYAELVQQFPASENHHHAYPGGMLDHGLEIVAYALKLRQSHLLPAGATPESHETTLMPRCIAFFSTGTTASGSLAEMAIASTPWAIKPFSTSICASAVVVVGPV